MGRLAILWMVGVGAAAAAPREPELERFQFDRVEMAVPIRLLFYAPDAATANGAAEAAFDRLSQLNGIFSDYDPQSEIRRLCDTAGEGKVVPISEELWEVLRHAQGLSVQSGGAFDVTVGPLVRLWRRARRQKELPAPSRLAEARALVGYGLIRFYPESRAVELTKRGMLLDFGAIAKGYAADQALAVLRQHGITRAMVHAGGDIALGQRPPDAPGWRVAVSSLDPKSPPQTILSLSRCAVATSGDTWQFVVIGGRRYSHIVDPRTGLGLTDHNQVTVVAPDGATADGLATAVSVLGPVEGLKLIERTPGAAALVRRAPQGKTEVFRSSRWRELRVVPVGMRGEGRGARGEG